MSSIAVNTITPATGSSVSIPAFVPAGQFSHRNKIINGKMEIAQRGTSFVGAAAVNAYTLDRFVCQLASTAVVNVAQQADAPSNNEFQNSFRVSVTTADTAIAAGDGCNIEHRIEGYNARDLIGKTFTLSFWVRSSKTGIHCVAFKNGGVSNNAADRSYVTEYTINAANTWEFKTITVSGGLITAGTWNWTTGTGLQVCWSLAAGSTTQTTANAWQTGLLNATANQVNCLDTIGNIFAITGVQLEAGSVATPFEHRPIGTELSLCQRYYWRVTGQLYAAFGSGGATNTTTAEIFVQYPVSMRAAPNVSQSNTALGDGVANTAVTSLGGGQINNQTGLFYPNVASGLTTFRPYRWFANNNANGYADFSAEL